ncbi:hypothetical protein D3C76_69270 [compost metagenome]
MDAEIRFIVRAPSNQTVFTHMEQVDQTIITAKIRERYGALELKMKQEAARHLLSNIVGAEYSNYYTVTFQRSEGGVNLT